MFKIMLFLLIGTSAMAQTVSTYFSDPSADVDDAMAFDVDGNLYGSNFSGTNVYKITPAGVATIFAGGLANPNGLAFDTFGNLFVVEYSGASIHKYDPNGSLIETYAVTGFVSGLVATPNGTMIYTNVSDESINEIATNGTITQLVAGGPLNAPVGLTYDDTNNLYIGNYVGREIYRLVGGSLEYVATVPDGGATANPFLGFITFHQGTGMLYGTVLGAHKIYEIDPTGVDQVVSFAGGIQGGTDGDISFATFDTPNGIFYNEADGALYVSEFSGEGNVRKIDFNIAGIEDTNEVSFALYPNPVASQLFVVSELGFEIAGVSVYDISGKIVLHPETETEQSVSIDVSTLAAGMYFLRVLDAHGHKRQYSFIKE